VTEVPVGWLADGTAYYAPVGCLPADGDRVRCHLCGRWFLSVASHLRVHGWTKAEYVAAFGLELGNPLSGTATRKRRSAALTARLAVEPAIQRAQAEARARAGSGALTVAASTAARGRPHPAQRRAKTLAALSGISQQARAEGNRRRADRHRAEIAAEVAGRFGFDTFAGYLVDRRAAGTTWKSLAAESGVAETTLRRHGGG